MKAKATEEIPTLYKVLMNGKSFHGGNLVWSLPQPDGKEGYTPGDWQEVKTAIACCQVGLHLTTEPIKWMKHGATVYLVETQDRNLSHRIEDKIAVATARLIRPLTADELALLNIFTEGEHEIREGFAFSSGSSTVEAYDSSTVEAYDSSTVEAYGSSTVEAYGSSTVEASGSSTVRASGSSTVRAYDSSTVISPPNYGSSKIIVAERSVWIDRRSGSPQIIVGGIQYRPAEQENEEGQNQ